MKPQDHLEQFIQTHRDAFDDQVPPAALWPAIQAQLNPTPRRRTRFIRLLQTSAAAVLLLAIGTIIGYRLIPQPAYALPETAIAELKETEHFYQQHIQKKLAQLTAHPADASVLHDLEHLDKSIEELKQALYSAPASRQPQLMAELIQHYQTKIDILELVLSRTRTIDSSRKNSENHEISL